MAFGLLGTHCWAERQLMHVQRSQQQDFDGMVCKLDLLQMRLMLQCQRPAIFDLLDIRFAEFDIVVRPNSASFKQIAPRKAQKVWIKYTCESFMLRNIHRAVVCILNMYTTALRTQMPITFKLPRDPQCEHQEHTHTHKITR